MSETTAKSKMSIKQREILKYYKELEEEQQQQQQQ